jgi:ADP-dependent phosphofructokinase/glucokinase
VPLVAPKVAVADPATTVTVAGTVSAAALLDSVMLAPPLGAP